MPQANTMLDILLVEDNPTDAELCIRALREHFISKPVEFDQFAETVVRLGFYWLLVNRQPTWISTSFRLVP